MTIGAIHVRVPFRPFRSVPNSVFVFGRIVSSVYMYSTTNDVCGRLHSVSASYSRSDRLIMGDE